MVIRAIKKMQPLKIRKVKNRIMVKKPMTIMSWMNQLPPQQNKPLKQYIHAIEKRLICHGLKKWVQPNENIIEGKSLKLKNSSINVKSAPYEFSNSFPLKDSFN